MRSHVVHGLELADTQDSLPQEASTSPQQDSDDELNSDEFSKLNPRRRQCRALILVIFCSFVLHSFLSLSIIMRSNETQCIFWSAVSILRSIVIAFMCMCMKSKLRIEVILTFLMCAARFIRAISIDSCAQVFWDDIQFGPPLRAGAFRKCMRCCHDHGPIKHTDSTDSGGNERDELSQKVLVYDTFQSARSSHNHGFFFPWL